MTDARSYRPGGDSRTDGLAPSAAVDAAFVSPTTYDEYLAASRADALAPDNPAHPWNLAKLEGIVTSNPGITPDAAVAAIAAPAAAGAIAGMTTEQRARQIALAIQQQRSITEVDGAPMQFLKALSRTAFNAIEAPFQIGLGNAAAYASAKLSGLEQPDGIGIAQVFTNTDIGWQITGLVSGDEKLGDQGQGWFAEPGTTAMNVKEQTDRDLAGGQSGSIGQRLADSLELQQGTSGYSILSGTVDFFSRALDPSMYVGAGELKAFAKGAQGLDAVAGAKAVRAGVGAAAADDALAPAKQAASAAFDAVDEINAGGKRLSQLQDALAEVRRTYDENVLPKAGEYRTQAAAHSEEADTLVARNIEAQVEWGATGARTARLEAEAALKAAEHQLRGELEQSVARHSLADENLRTMLGEGHMLPEQLPVPNVPGPRQPNGLPEGYSFGEPQIVHLAPPTPAQVRRNEQLASEGVPMPWAPAENLVDEGTLGSQAMVKRTVLGPDGEPVGVHYTHADDGFTEHIGVHPDHQRKGLASALWKYGEQHADEAGLPRPQHAADEADFTEAGAAWRRKLEGADEAPVPQSWEELPREVVTDGKLLKAIRDYGKAAEADARKAWEEQHADALTWLSVHLDLNRFEENLLKSAGVIPLRKLEDLFAKVEKAGGEGVEVEEINAVLQQGHIRFEQGNLNTPINDWRSQAFRYGEEKAGGRELVRGRDANDPAKGAHVREKADRRPTVVRLGSWWRTKSDFEDARFAAEDEYRQGVVDEAAAAARPTVPEPELAPAAPAAPPAPPVNVIPASSQLIEDARTVRAAIEKVAPDLAEEFAVPAEAFRYADGLTPGEVIDSIEFGLRQEGVAERQITRVLYSLNDDLMKAGIVVDGHPLLAPAGRGRAAAETYLERELLADGLDDAVGQHSALADVLVQMRDEAAAGEKALDEAPIQRAQTRAERAGRKANELEAKAVAATARKVASLQRRYDEVAAQVAAAEARRDEHLAVLAAIRDAAARKAGAPTPPIRPDDVEGQLNFLRDLAGLRTTADGVDVASIDRGLKFFTGVDAEPLYRAVVALENPAQIHTLTRGKLPAAMTVELAAAKSVDEARAVFTRYLGRGMVDETTGRLRALRIAGRAAMNGADPDRMLSRYDKAFGGAAKVTTWANAAGRRNVPWANGRHIEDAEGMTNLVSDTINYMERLWRPARNEAGGELHDKWVNAMLTAGSAEQRRTVWYSMLDDVAERAAKAQGLSDEATDRFVTSLKASMNRQRQLTSYTAEARAANGALPLTLNGKPLPKDIATLEAEMSTRVMTPDWREMRRALKKAEVLEKKAAGNPELRDAMLEASDAIFDKFWRTSVLAFRGGYILRNMADIQARMFLAGHPSVFTNPHGLLALALSHRLDPNSAVGRIINRAERADVDVDGKPFERLEGDEADLLEVIDGFRRVQARDISLLDPGSPARAMRLGEVPVTRDHPLFFRGWANELGLMWASPMASDVLKVLAGRQNPRLREWMTRTGITDRREALVDYMWSGPGKVRLDRLRDNSRTLGDRIVTRDDLRAYLFGDEAVSLASRWKRLTLDLDPKVVEHAMGKGLEDAIPDGQGVKAASSFLERRDATANILRELSKGRIDQPDFPVQSVRAPVWADRNAESAFLQKAERATDAFFTFSSHIEKDLGYLPEFRYAKWDKAAQLASALSPEDAARLVVNAEKALGGVPGSWARNTLAELKRQAKRADGDGAFDLADLKHITDEHGVAQVRTMFYDAQKRNAFGHALRLASPFAQAWANSLKTWSKLAVGNTRQVYKAQLAYTAGQGKGTAWFTDDPSNPDDALFYNDPKTGQAMVGIPVAGSVLAALGSLVSMAQGGQAIGASDVGVGTAVQGYNLLFQNGMLPGVGPVVQIPATMLDSTDQYQALVPDWAKRMLVPYTNVDPDRDPGLLEAMTPGWFGQVLAGVGVPGFQERVTKYVKPAMSQLFSKDPERYLNDQGFLDPDGQARLLREANALAHGITFGRGLLQNSSASAPLPELYAKDRNGNNLSQVVLAQEFGEATERTGSRELAMAELMDKYGVEPLLTMLPNREFGFTPTNGAYSFVKDNPDVADSHGSVLSLFLPGGGYSAYMDRWQRKRGDNPAMGPDEQIDFSNGLLFEAQMGQLEARLVRGELDQDTFEALEAQLRDDYKEVPQASRTLNGRNVAVKEISDALQEPKLAQTEAGHAADVYLRLREQALAASGGGALGGQSDAPLRAWLRQQGEELALQYPEFLVMWTKVFRGEVKD